MLWRVYCKTPVVGFAHLILAGRGTLAATFGAMSQIMRHRSRRAQMKNPPLTYVPDYAGYGLIDGTQAYYVWDYDHQSRGGTPLVLAFSSYLAALNEARYRNSSVMDYNDVMASLESWADTDRDRIYWRGSNQDQWDTARWDSAWDNRWEGWGWDHQRGWSNADANLDQTAADRLRIRQGRSDRVRQDKIVQERNRRQQDKTDRIRQDKVKQDRARDKKDNADRVRRDKDKQERERDKKDKTDHERDAGGKQDKGENGHGQGNGKGHNK